MIDVVVPTVGRPSVAVLLGFAAVVTLIATRVFSWED